VLHRVACKKPIFILVLRGTQSLILKVAGETKFQIEYTRQKWSYWQISKPLEVYCIMPNSTQLEASSFQITDILYQIPAEFSAENPLTC
jgi:hypothetical protein